MISEDKSNLVNELEKWKSKKGDNIFLQQSYSRLGNKYNNHTLLSVSNSVGSCSDYLEFKLFKDGSKKLHRAFFCKNRLCPVCNWRKSKKVFHQVAKIVNKIDASQEYSYLFLTLTSKNCTPDKLSDEITNLLDAFRRMFHNQKGDKRIRKISKGFFRTLEVTYNKKTNTYNPHIHCIVVVDKNYFSSINYIDQKKCEWSDIWKKCLKADYNPVVWVERVKDKSSNRTKLKGIKEVSKYSVKGNDVIIKNKSGEVMEDDTDSNVYDLHFALKGRRLISMGGIFKELHKELNLEDPNKEDINLINLNKQETEILDYIIVECRWHIGLGNYTIIN